MSEGIVSWGIPAIAKAAIKNQTAIAKTWQTVAEYLQGRIIAFTGIAGIGKTVLFEHLCHAETADKLPPASIAAEKGHTVKKHVDKRLRVTVVPGEESSPKFETLTDLFQRGKKIEGVVHVVANGFVEIRDEFARESLATTGKLKTIDQFIKFQRKAELEDLGQTCEVIRQSIARTRTPKWLIVAVTKVDLFQDGLDEAKRYYSPHGKSLFTQRLNQLQSQVGTDNFRWEAVPVCAWLTDFQWNGEVKKSTLNLEDRNKYLGQFAKELGRFCG